MNKAVLSILIGTLALLTGGCSLFGDREPEENVVKPVPIQVETQQQAEPEEFADIEEPVGEIAGLIPATNPDVRVRSSVRGRNDPFSVVTLNPRIEIEPQESPTPTPTPQPNRNDRPNRTQNSPQPTVSNPSPMPVPPPLEPPNPALARDVVITGLYQADGTTKLIVREPEAENSRYVEVGQYLSNGRVLVKSIDTSRYPPVVILEQSGVEVAKAIGEDSESEEVSFLSPASMR